MSDPATLPQVIDVLTSLLKRKGAIVPPLSAATPLDGGLGLDSLDFAEVVVKLERAFGTDPFASGRVDRLQTVGDLAALYER